MLRVTASHNVMIADIAIIATRSLVPSPATTLSDTRELDVCRHDRSAYCGQYTRSETATKYPALAASRTMRYRVVKTMPVSLDAGMPWVSQALRKVRRTTGAGDAAVR